MKIIHSFINPLHPHHVPVETLHIGIYSCLRAIELYGNCTFASNKTLIEKFKELQLPYTDYEVLDYDYNNNKFPYLSKLYSYKNQTSPFIHLDMDLILLDTLENQENNIVKFSHRDISSEWDFSSLDGVFDAYIEPSLYTFKKYGKEFLKKLRIDQIPNMGIVLCNKPEMFTPILNKVLDFYFDNQEYFDKNWAAGCFLEQALIHKFLLENNHEYYESLFDLSAYLHKKPPIVFVNDINNTIQINDWYHQKNSISLNYDEFMLNFNLEEFPCVHFLGDSKLNKNVQFLIIEKLYKMIGIEKLNKIQLYFGNGYENYLNTYKKLYL